MNLINELTAAKAVFLSLMTDHLQVMQDVWCLMGIDVQDGDLVFRCVDQSMFMDDIPFSLRVPASVLTGSLDAEDLLAVAREDEQFLFSVRCLHEETLWARIGRKGDVEVDFLLTEAEKQDRDSQRYVDYYVRLGVDPALL